MELLQKEDFKQEDVKQTEFDQLIIQKRVEDLQRLAR
jgi:hypothetical protein